MKKLLFTLTAGLLAGLSFATPSNRLVYGTGSEVQTHSTEMQSLRTHSETPSQPFYSLRNTTESPRVSFEESPIYEAPDGITKEYVRDAWGFFLEYSYFGYGGSGSKAAHIVEGNDGYYYIYNPVCRFDTKTYLKCEKRDDKLVAKLPQCVYSEYDDDYNEWFYYLDIYNKVVDENGEFWYEQDEDIDEVTFSIREDGSIIMDLDSEPAYDEEGNYLTPETILGLGTEGYWMYLGDNVQIYTPFTKTLVELPENANIEKWVFKSQVWNEEKVQWVNVAIIDNDFYLSGVEKEYLPGAWIKGTIEGDKVVFPSGQYVGTIWGFYIYMYGATDMGDSVSLDDSLVFDYDIENSIMTTGENTILLFNGSIKKYDPLSDYGNPSIQKQRTDINPMPQNPIIYYYDNCLEEDGFSYLSFDLSDLNVDGDLLDTDNMWYEVYIDGEVYTFTPELYIYLDEPMTQIPYNFTDSYEYDFVYWGHSRGIYFYVEVLDSIGLRLYNEFNGEVYATDLVTCSEVTSIKQVNSSEVEAEEYYTLTGIRANNPQNGIFIKRTHLSNGKIITEKVRK